MGFQRVASFLAFVLSALLAAIGNAQNTATIGRTEPFSLRVQAGAPRIEQVSAPGAKFLTVHFAYFQLPAGDRVVVRSADGNTQHEYTRLGRGDSGLDGGFFSSIVPGSVAVIEYVSATIASPTGEYGFEVDKYTRSTGNAQPSALCGAGDTSKLMSCYANSSLVPEAATKARAVARLLVNGVSTCTGWLLGSEGHLITNNHCIGDQSDATSVDVLFETEPAPCTPAPPAEDLATLLTNGVVQVANSAKLVAWSGRDSLDYSLVQLTLRPGVDLSSFGFLQIRVQGAQAGEQIYIPQQSKRGRTRIAATLDSDDVVARIDGVDVTAERGKHRLQYAASTVEGASGSPVLAASDNKVIGLHNYGNCKNDAPINSAVDIRAIVRSLNTKKALPRDALDEAPERAPTGPWDDFPTDDKPKPDVCAMFKKQAACEGFANGLCVWKGNGVCVKAQRQPAGN